MVEPSEQLQLVFDKAVDMIFRTYKPIDVSRPAIKSDKSGIFKRQLKLK